MPYAGEKSFVAAVLDLAVPFTCCYLLIFFIIFEYALVIVSLPERIALTISFVADVSATFSQKQPDSLIEHSIPIVSSHKIE